MLSSLLGPGLDSIFQSLGFQNETVRYGLYGIIAPRPLLAHDGPKESQEPTRLQTAEYFDTYRMRLPMESLQLSLESAIAARTRTLDEQLVAGTIQRPQYDRDIAALAADYTVAKAIAPKRTWYISRNNGGTWLQYRTTGDPQIDSFNYILTLIKSPGIASGKAPC
jgi:hypothetical protein